MAEVGQSAQIGFEEIRFELLQHQQFRTKQDIPRYRGLLESVGQQLFDMSFERREKICIEYQGHFNDFRDAAGNVARRQRRQKLRIVDVRQCWIERSNNALFTARIDAVLDADSHIDLANQRCRDAYEVDAAAENRCRKARNIESNAAADRQHQAVA